MADQSCPCLVTQSAPSSWGLVMLTMGWWFLVKKPELHSWVHFCSQKLQKLQQRCLWRVRVQVVVHPKRWHPERNLMITGHHLLNHRIQCFNLKHYIWKGSSKFFCPHPLSLPHSQPWWCFCWTTSLTWSCQLLQDRWFLPPSTWLVCSQDTKNHCPRP